jgi:hypothetical protein
MLCMMRVRCILKASNTLLEMVFVRKQYQSHLLARDVNAVGNDGHGTGKTTAFIDDSKQLCTTVLFMLRHTFDLGLSPFRSPVYLMNFWADS